jgi:nucleoside-diphosphate-sugar epimerase
VFETARLAGVKRVVTASSCAATGPHPPVETNIVEEELEPPTNLYGICKLWAEQVANYYNLNHGMEIVSLRICSVLGFGRRDRASLRSGLMSELPNVMYAPELAAYGETVTMPRDDELYDFLHASDAGQAWWLALSAERLQHFVFNVRTDQRPARDYTAQIRKLLPDAKIEISDQPGYLPPVMDNTRLLDELGLKPRYNVETGIQDYIERVLEARA